jgi:hypothetical protein
MANIGLGTGILRKKAMALSSRSSLLRADLFVYLNYVAHVQNANPK